MNFNQLSLKLKKLITTISSVIILSACAGPARYAWMKEGASDHQRTNDVSECKYQILLNKTPVAEQNELRNLCMQGKGYRLKRVS